MPGEIATDLQLDHPLKASVDRRVDPSAIVPRRVGGEERVDDVRRLPRHGEPRSSDDGQLDLPPICRVVAVTREPETPEPRARGERARFRRGAAATSGGALRD